MDVRDEASRNAASGPAAPIAALWRLARRADPLVVLAEGDGAPDHGPLYCIHSITGDVDGQRFFASRLGGLRVLGIQVPKGRMNASFGASIPAMARAYADMLMAVQPTGPIALAGWSAGAIIALEIAQNLRARGRDVPLLVAVDGAPCNTGGGLSVWNPLYALRVIANVPRWIRDDRHEDWSWAGFARRIEFKVAAMFGIGSKRLARVQTLDAGRVDDLLQRAWSADQKGFIHAMFKAMADHVASPYDGRVIVYETRTQPLYHLRQVGAAWRRIAPHSEIVSLRGNHSEIVRDGTVAIIAGDLLARLQDARPAKQEILETRRIA